MIAIKIKNINAARAIYDQLPEWRLARQTIDFYFKKFPENNNEEIVLIKVCLIDHLYRTNTMGVVSVARHILDQNIDRFIDEEPDKAIEKIRRWKNNKGKNIDILSFASKYCHFHKKEMYPIYDKYASNALANLACPYPWKRNCRDYALYTKTIKESFHGFTLEEIDTYLWLYGIREALNQPGQYVSREVQNLYRTDKKLFDAL